jgi:DsbC/DsbD-like thiol-disulfide interchange protein
VIKTLEIKRAIKIVFFLMGILIFSAGINSAQDDVVGVKPYISKIRIRAGDTFKVALLVQISPGWHIHAHELLDDFLIPTDFTIDEKEKISILKYSYPDPISEKFDYSDNELQIYDGDTLIGALIKTEKDLSPGTHKMNGRFQYQACDDSSCVAPKTIKLEILINIVGSGGLSEVVHEEIFSKIKFEKETAS